MKVKDLIEKLKSFPADEEVLVQGYEDGFDGVAFIQKMRVVKRFQPRNWEGEYEEAEKDSKAAITVVVIEGNRR